MGGRGLDRRELIAGMAAGTLAGRARAARDGAAAGAVVGVAELAEPATGAIAGADARRAVSGAIKAATGAASAVEGLRRLFRPTDVVGIKLNCLGGRRLSPRPALLEALVALLGAAGVPAERVVAFDRSSREVERAGFTIRRGDGSWRCHGIDNDYDREPSTSGAIGSCFARLVSTTCTALVGFGVVKDHDLSGVSASLKNWYGVIHNPNKYHDNNCDPYLADVVNHPFVRGKLRLTLLDGVLAQCHGGPAFRPDGCWPLGLVAASTDPVAADAWAARVIDAERARRGLPSLEQAKRPPRYLATAARYGLGVADPARVREVRA